MNLNQLAQLEQLRSLASQKALAKVQAKEASLRQQLKALQDYRSELYAPDAGLSQMRAIGADVLWHKWLDQTQRTLNISLARVLAEKEGVLKRARKDIGRTEAVSNLREDTLRHASAARQKSNLASVMEASVMQHFHKI